MTKGDPEVESVGWIVSVWIIGQILSLLHCAASLFLAYAVGLALWEASKKDSLAIMVELCVLVWMVAVSYVSLQQIRFSWSKIMTREVERTKER